MTDQIQARATLPAPPRPAHQAAVWGRVPDGAWWLAWDGEWQAPHLPRPAGELFAWYTLPDPEWYLSVAFEQIARARQQLQTPIYVELAGGVPGGRLYGLPVLPAPDGAPLDHVRVGVADEG